MSKRRQRRSAERLPRSLKRVFWNVDFAALDPRRDVDAIIARVVEFGVLEEVQWLIGRYGLDRIHQFFRDEGSPELSERTVTFWRAVFKAEDERWPGHLPGAGTAPRPGWIDAGASAIAFHLGG